MSIRKTASGKIQGVERPDDTLVQVHEPGGANLKEVTSSFLGRRWDEDDERGLAEESDRDDDARP